MEKKFKFCTVSVLKKGGKGMPSLITECHPFGVAPKGFTPPPTWKQAGMWDTEFSPESPIVLIGSPEQFIGKDVDDILGWEKAGIACQIISLLPEPTPIIGRWSAGWGEKWGDHLDGIRPSQFFTPSILDAEFLPPTIGDGQFFLVTREVFDAHPERVDLVTIGGVIDTPIFAQAIEWLLGREEKVLRVPSMKDEFQCWDLPVLIKTSESI